MYRHRSWPVRPVLAPCSARASVGRPVRCAAIWTVGAFPGRRPPGAPFNDAGSFPLAKIHYQMTGSGVRALLRHHVSPFGLRVARRQQTQRDGLGTGTTLLDSELSGRRRAAMDRQTKREIWIVTAASLTPIPLLTIVAVIATLQ